MNRIIKNINFALKIFKKKEPKEQKLTLSSLKRLLPYIKKHWKKAAVGSFLIIIVSLLALPTPLLMKYIIDDVIIARNFQLLNLIVLLLIVIHFLKLIFSFLTSYIFNILNQEVLLIIKNDLFKRILRLPLSFFDVNQTGYIMSRISEVNNLGIFFSNAAIRIIIAIFEFIFCISIIFFMHWKLTIVSMLILPFFYLTAKYYSKGIRKTSWDLLEKGAHLSKQFQESIAGVELVKTFASEDRENQKVKHNLKNFMQSSIINSIIQSLSTETLALLGALGGFIVLWYGGAEIIRGNFTVGGYIAFSAYLAKLYGPTQIIASISLTMQPALSALNRILELNDLTSDEEDNRRTIKLSKLNGKIEFKHVFFSYDNKKDALHDINFIIKPGEKIALIGQNGSGKSTIIKLLLGLYQTKRGEILIDDQDIKKINLSTLRERISTVSQNVFLFCDSIKNNLLYSFPSSQDKEIIKAAKNADAYDFIMNLENGFNTIIGERGKKLSGGEKQKISIARAILKDSDILIFDEATSYIDGESKKKIHKNINKYFNDKTCIIISHEVPALINLNKIYKLKKGKLIQNKLV